MENRFIAPCISPIKSFEAVNCSIDIKIKSEIISAIHQFGTMISSKNLNQAGLE